MLDIIYNESDQSAVVGQFVHHSNNIPLNHQKTKSNETRDEFSVSSRKTQETKIKVI